VDDELRTFYYFWKYANLTPSEVYQKKKTDMGEYFRIAPDGRSLNYDKFYVEGDVLTEGDEAYTSHNTKRLDVDGVVSKILKTDYVKEELEGRPHVVEA